MRKNSFLLPRYMTLAMLFFAGCMSEEIIPVQSDPLPKSSLTSPIGFVKGFSWGWTGRRGQYEGSSPAESMQKLAATNANWVCLAFGVEMETFDCPKILWSDANPEMVTDTEIRRAIQLARDNDLHVILKPVVNIRDGTWRAWIKFENDNGTKDLQAWDQWWEAFQTMLMHYAEIAQETNCEMLCLGCEMEAIEDDEDQWRALVSDIRKVYNGVLTYNTNWGREEAISWWDAVDVISISAYYPVGSDDANKWLRKGLSNVPESDNTIEAIKKRWLPIKEKLATASRKHHRPILFIEIGVCSIKGFSAAPWMHEQPDAVYDGNEQRRYYQAAMETFWNEPWFMGFTWWDWPPNLYTLEDAKNDTGFCVYGKPAENLITEWYGKIR